MLMRCFYVSRIAEGVSDVDMQVILGVAQLNNRRRDVTGMLAISDGYFAQVLEGREAAIAALLVKIRGDSRHRDVRVLLEENITTRQFARWTMGVVRRDDRSEETRRLHGEGCVSPEHARTLISTLFSLDD